MVFKRREKLTPLKWLSQVIWPKGGWSRAARYLQHRLHRLPDTPHKIARGVFAGVFTVFTPLFGFHFFIAYAIAKLTRGNVIAALLATFVGNPLTYVPIGVISMKMGHFILGTRFNHEAERSLVGKFFDAADDFWQNFLALFTERDTNWDALIRFFHEIFLPYLVGGILPGIVAGLAAYYVTLPMIAAYQKSRRGRLKAKLEELRRKKAAAKKVPPNQV
ncbi:MULTISPECIES: DUF2062 domain-containing protein [Roseobacteraceae]|uniref:DUF2062 domain-containing protein n=1 Tax=Celeribacter baekdonensis B30 TaxID=1208323 RepID=K2JUQ2_9RHOB|nr:MULTISPECIES: DUF2062 domain-containing protein [Roseobacteraceae]EKE74084.1 hypothetical protein B30_00120 [Celeribacter baekdonensis B30]KAB6716894.1 DUF2062 domain-containing protein [Roseobacter sp. TSBP12]